MADDVEYVTDADLRQGLDQILTSVGYTVAELQAMAKVDRFPTEDADRAWFAVDWILRCLAQSESAPADADLDDIIAALRIYGQGGERAGRVTCARAADELDRLRSGHNGDLLAEVDDWFDSLPRLYYDHAGEYSIPPGLVRRLADALRYAPCPHVVTDGTTSHCSLAARQVDELTRELAVPWSGAGPRR